MEQEKSLGETAACCGKKKHRSPEEKTALVHRASRIEGQLRGIRSMLEADAYCVDILTQVAAAKAALGALERALLSDHIRSCVVSGVQAGDASVVEELTGLLQKYVN